MGTRGSKGMPLTAGLRRSQAADTTERYPRGNRVRIESETRQSGPFLSKRQNRAESIIAPMSPRPGTEERM